MRRFTTGRIELGFSRLAIGVLAVALLTTGCSNKGGDEGADAGASASAYKVAIIAPLTGPASSLGQSGLKGIQYWVDTTNADGGIDGRQVDLEQCDSKGTPDGASQCARSLSGEADVYIAPGLTAEVTAVQAQLPREIVLSISPNVTPEEGSTFFQVGVPVRITMDVLFDDAKAAGIKHIGVLASTDASGEATIAPAEAAAKRTGLQLSVTRIEPQDVAASGQLTQLEADGVELIYVSYSGAGSATVVQAYSRLGLTTPFVLNSASVTNELLSVIKDSRPANVLHLNQIGALVPDMLDGEDRTRTQEFLDAYQDETGGPADGLIVQLQYVGDTAAAALQAGAGDDPAAAAEALSKGTISSLTDITFETPEGAHYSEGLHPSLISSTADGQWTPPVFAGA
jgi:branched-chain amino acid transport system substrate-binding protein